MPIAYDHLTESVSTLPRAHIPEPTFHEALDEWMSRAPWLLISLAAHFVAALAFAALPWSERPRPAPERIIEMAELAPLEVLEDPPEEPEEVIVEEPTETEVDVEDVVVPDAVLDPVDPSDTPEGDPTFDPDDPFEAFGENPVLGVGPGAGGKYGQRFGRGDGRPGRGGRAREEALVHALDWLALHQDEDGRWDCDGFMRHDPPADPCTGAGDPNHDVGVTALALLAFLGDGHTLRLGEHRAVVARGVQWLRAQQDPESGLVGEAIGHTFLYDHALATLALCETYHLDRSPLLRGPAQRAVNYVTRARNPYGAWRYDVPPIGDNDTSVTGWMVFALKAAEDAGLAIDREAYTGARNWLDAMTDPGTGRCGYDSVGSPSSRVEGRNDHYPTSDGEAMTAVALLCRIFMGEGDTGPGSTLAQHAELLRRSPPVWRPGVKANDHYYWYYGTYALFQFGGEAWQAWDRALASAVLDSQRRDGAHRGSWDPAGPWGWSGGRVYSTALMALCLEVHYRYGRVLGGR